ncbi:hypothetical protein M758_7G099800 [Ceratodon purpureus]|uniref:Myb-like domain-containing protein n=1 Tax=Ceratodon purpureus TaxID=3225 RepID=A0A8T0H728_CERPU|nr:hypothetical protein KC19_7G105700 [Ceratodon purpureus]KAG0610893.1 hypothetical protein M758_7G099800 [Ceratodon purpureus]
MEETGAGEASDPTQEDAIGGALNGSQLQLHSFGGGIAGTVDSSLNGRTCGSNKKRSRSAPWTVSEMLTLIEAKKEERERCHAYKSQGVKLPAAEKWRVVATHMEAKEMGRSGSQCQDKWENMMKDYKSVREWQFVGGGAKDYFKDMTNKERKDASLPPQMDEIVFYSLHAIQNEKEEKKDRVKWKEQDQFKNHHVSSSTPIAIKDKVGSSEGNDMESIDTDSSGKRRRGKRLHQEQQQQTRVCLDHHNPVVLNDFVHAMKDGSKELIDCFMKVLERSDRRQEAVEMESSKPKDTATLARVLVALADAVKTVAQKL